MNQINVNINSQTYVSLALLPKLLQRDGNKRSAIINVSSVCALEPRTMLAIYAATKAFNLHLGNCFTAIYRERIDVLNVTPNSVKSQMNSGRYVYGISAENFANACLNQLGWVNQSRGHWKHAV